MRELERLDGEVVVVVGGGGAKSKKANLNKIENQFLNLNHDTTTRKQSQFGNAQAGWDLTRTDKDGFQKIEGWFGVSGINGR